MLGPRSGGVPSASVAGLTPGSVRRGPLHTCRGGCNMSAGPGPGQGQAFVVAKSTDGGCTWGSARKVTGPVVVDKASIAADAHATSPFRDNIYMAWDQQ